MAQNSLSVSTLAAAVTQYSKWLLVTRDSREASCWPARVRFLSDSMKSNTGDTHIGSYIHTSTLWSSILDKDKKKVQCDLVESKPFSEPNYLHLNLVEIQFELLHFLSMTTISKQGQGEKKKHLPDCIRAKLHIGSITTLQHL